MNQNWKIHDLAQCKDCDWEEDTFYHKNPSKACQEHANKNKHHVIREIGRTYRYEPK